MWEGAEAEEPEPVLSTKEEIKNKFKFYPNPVKTNFTIDAPRGTKFTVIDSTGKVIIENNSKRKTQNKIASFNAGIYTLLTQLRI
ncbi:T9SS type A sorting domain-containing protein [Marivirga arenosa]|uniref:T9SS type A sorting domain-containing protein n=1 Tax=Marivirga arenosa TaxID=3059076 RepID=UPI00389916ED